MERRERTNDREEAIRVALDSLQARMHTALPGIVVSYDPATMTVVVQPAVLFEQRGQDGVWRQVTPSPIITNVPVMMAGGGGFSATFPLAVGDEGWLIFSERCIDAWWQQGGIQPQAEHRMHDMSDAAFFPKTRSKPKALSPAPSSTTAQLRTDDGTTYAEIAPGGIVNIKAPTKITLDTPIVEVTGVIQVDNVAALATSFSISGALTATGQITAGSGTGGAIHVLSHTHPDPQGGTSGAPNPGS